jgi:hypothetical protein
MAATGRGLAKPGPHTPVRRQRRAGGPDVDGRHRPARERRHGVGRRWSRGVVDGHWPRHHVRWHGGISRNCGSAAPARSVRRRRVRHERGRPDRRDAYRRAWVIGQRRRADTGIQTPGPPRPGRRIVGRHGGSASHAVVGKSLDRGHLALNGSVGAIDGRFPGRKRDQSRRQQARSVPDRSFCPTPRHARRTDRGHPHTDARQSHPCRAVTLHRWSLPRARHHLWGVCRHRHREPA